MKIVILHVKLEADILGTIEICRCLAQIKHDRQPLRYWLFVLLYGRARKSSELPALTITSLIGTRNELAHTVCSVLTMTPT